MAKLLIILFFVIYNSFVFAGNFTDTLIVNESEENQTTYREYKENFVNETLESLKNFWIGDHEEGVFFRHTYIQDIIIYKMYAFFSFVRDSVYINLDPSTTSSIYESDNLFNVCVRKIVREQQKKNERYCNDKILLNKEMKEWFKSIIKEKGNFISAYRSYSDDYEFNYRRNDNIISWQIPSKGLSKSFILSEFLSFHYTFVEMEKERLKNCRWDNFVDNDTIFLDYLSSGGEKKFKCPIN